MRQEVWTSLARLKGAGLSILVIDKNLDDLRAFADRHYVMDKGRNPLCGKRSRTRPR